MRAFLAFEVLGRITRHDPARGNAVEIRAKRGDVVAGRFGRYSGWHRGHRNEFKTTSLHLQYVYSDKNSYHLRCIQFNKNG